jgi:putative endonuclease
MTARDTTNRGARGARGRWSETLAAISLLAVGYRVLARQWRSSAGEIDLIAVRGRRLVFAEVKSRSSVSDDEAHGAVSSGQIRRIHRAADQWLARHPQYREHDISFDLLLVAPGRWPRRIENAF